MRDRKELAMRILITSIIIGPLLLIGALPATAGGSTASDTPVRLAAGSNSPADRDTYTHEAQHEMQEWQQKLHAFSVNAEAKGKEAGDTAENDLNTAWAAAESASRALEVASAEGWENAKISYKKASQELADAWDKVRPQDK
jgi:hypothetical protein